LALSFPGNKDSILMSGYCSSKIEKVSRDTKKEVEGDVRKKLQRGEVGEKAGIDIITKGLNNEKELEELEEVVAGFDSVEECLEVTAIADKRETILS
jgi:hypothetical protein